VAEAEAQFARGESLAPWNDRFGWWLGRLALAKGDAEAAIGHLGRSLAINPHALLTHLPMAQAKLQRAQQHMQAHRDDSETALALLDDAAGHAEALLALCPGFGRAEGVLGQIAAVAAIYLTAAGDETQKAAAEAYWEQAEAQLERALRHGVKGESAQYRMLAKVRLARGKPLQAEAALVRAALADPADEETWPLFIDYANSNRRYDRIRNTLYAQIRALQEATPPNANALASSHLWLANVLENGYRDWAGVDAAYLAAVEYGPKRPEIWANFARYAQERARIGLLKQAVAQSTARMQLAGDKPLPHVTALATVLQFGPRALADASAVLVEQARSHPASGGLSAAQAYGWVARMMLESLQATPGDGEGPCEAYMNLGIAMAAMQDPQMAERLYQAANTCLPPDGLAFLSIHWADLRVRLGDLDGALAHLHTGRGHNPDNLDVRWALARTLHRAQRNAEALQEYEGLLGEEGLDAKARAVLERERDAIRAAS
jgi:tetratricopeptide (TPR) repeat protein